MREEMNRRKIVLYIALLAIIIGGAPYFTGYLVETKFKDVVKVTSEFGLLNITVLEYDRGWRKSYAKTRVTLRGKFLQKIVSAMEADVNNQEKGAPNAALPQLSVVLEHEIRHGPFVQLKDKDYKDWLFALAAIHSKLFLTKENKEILISELGQTELFNLKGEITIEGVVHVALQGRPLTLKEADGKERMFWKGMQGKWQLSRDMKYLQGELLLPGFDFDWDGARYYGEEIAFKIDRFRTPEGLWLGKGTLGMQRLTIKEDQEPSPYLSIAGLLAGSVSDTENGMLDSATNLRIEQIKYAGKTYGPINCAMTVKNIETYVAKIFLELVKKVSLSTEQGQQVDYKQVLKGLIPELLKTRPEITVEGMSVHTDQGDIKGFLNFAIGGPQANDINHPAQIIQSIAAKTNITFPKVFLRDVLTAQYTSNARAIKMVEAQQQGKTVTDEEITQQVSKDVDASITAELAKGTLIEKDQNYVVEIQFQQGKLTINGKLIALPSFTPLPSPPMLPAPTPPGVAPAH